MQIVPPCPPDPPAAHGGWWLGERKDFVWGSIRSMERGRKGRERRAGSRACGCVCRDAHDDGRVRANAAHCAFTRVPVQHCLFRLPRSLPPPHSRESPGKQTGGATPNLSQGRPSLLRLRPLLRVLPRHRLIRRIGGIVGTNRRHCCIVIVPPRSAGAHRPACAAGRSAVVWVVMVCMVHGRGDVRRKTPTRRLPLCPPLHQLTPCPLLPFPQIQTPSLDDDLPSKAKFSV